MRLHDRVGVYTATPLADAEKLEVKRHVVRVVTCCLMGRPFKTYHRHRWAGVDISVGQVGMCAAWHGLLWHEYEKFAAAHADGDSHILISNAS